MKKKTRLPSFKSLEDESDYWDKHSLTEHLDEFKATRMKLRGPVKHLLSIRIDMNLVRRIRRIAESRGTPYQTLMHRWLHERADQEAPALDTGAVLSSKYQLVIPRSIRRRLNLRSGQRMTILVKDSAITLVPERPLSKLQGIAKRIRPGVLREKRERMDIRRKIKDF